MYPYKKNRADNLHVSGESTVSWSRYAQAYDLLCSINPHYAQNVELFRRWFASIPHKDGSVVCEIGAGTGNFLLAAADLKSKLRYVHWDFNSEMNHLAAEKYRRAKIEVEIVEKDLEFFPSSGEAYDAIIAVNCLYTIKEPIALVERVFEALEPGGYFFCIDIGRPLDTTSWLKELLIHNFRTQGFVKTARLLVALREAIRQNRYINKVQGRGVFKGHESDEFRQSFERAGFRISEQTRCYRDICDLLVAQRPLDIQVELPIELKGADQESPVRHLAVGA